MALHNGSDFHLAAILKRGKSTVRIGVNQARCHGRFNRKYKDGSESATLHAEMDALIAARPGDTLIVLRWHKSGKISMSRPCPHCQKHIREADLRKVMYSNWDGIFVSEKF